MNVITNQPDGTRDIHVTTEIGSHGYRMGEVVVDGNIVPDMLDGRVAIRFNNFDGDIASLHTDDLGERKIGAFRGGLRFTGRMARRSRYLEATRATKEIPVLSAKGCARIPDKRFTYRATSGCPSVWPDTECAA